MKPGTGKINSLALVLLVAALLASGCAGTQEKSVDPLTVTGITRYKGSPLPGGEAVAMRAEPGGIMHTAAIGADGSFSFQIPPGPYFLMARSSHPETGKDLFSFWDGLSKRFWCTGRKPPHPDKCPWSAH